jgi:WD40 repeat protein
MTLAVLLGAAAAQAQGQQAGGSASARAYRAYLLKAQKALEENDLQQLRRVLDDYRVPAGEPDPRSWEWTYLEGMARAAERAQPRPRLTLPDVGDAVKALRWTGTGERLLVQTAQSAILFDAATGRRLRSFAVDAASVSLSPDGERLAVAAWKWERAPQGVVAVLTVQAWQTATAKVIFSRVEMGTSPAAGDWATKKPALAWGPDGRRLAFGDSEGCALRVWDAATGKETVYRGHRDAVIVVTWGRDGKRLVSGSCDGTARVWDAETGRQVFLLGGLDTDVPFAVLDPAGKRLAVACKNGRVLVQDLASRHVLLEEYAGAFQNLAWSADGRYLMTEGESSELLDPQSGQPLLTCNPSTTSLTAFRPDGQRLALVGNRAGERGWFLLSCAPGSAVQRLATFAPLTGQQRPTALAWRPDGKEVAAANAEGKVEVWDLAVGDGPAGRRFHQVASFRWSPDSRRLALLVGSPEAWERERGGRRWPVHIASLTPGEPLLRLEGDCGPEAADLRQVTPLAWSKDGQRLASAGHESGSIYLWDVPRRRIAHRLAGHTKQASTGSWDANFGILALLWSPTGRRLASTATDGTLKVWDAASGQELVGLDYAGDSNGRNVHLAGWSADDRYLAFWRRIRIGDDFNAVYRLFVLDLATGQGAAHLKPEWLEGCTALAWRPDGKQIAIAVSGDRFRGVRVLDLETGAAAARLNLADRVERLNWSPDGKRLLINSWLWDTAAKARIDIVGCGPDVVWSPDGKQLAALAGGVVSVWEAATGKQVRRLRKGTTEYASGEKVEVGFPGRQQTLAWTTEGLHLLLHHEGVPRLQVLDPATAKTLFFLPAERRPGEDEATRFTTMVWRPDGKALAVQAERGIEIRDALTGQLVHRVDAGYNPHPHPSWAWSPDGAYLATADGAGLRIWDVLGRGKNNRTVDTGREYLRGRTLAWSPDSQQLAAVVVQKEAVVVKVWEAATGKETFAHDLGDKSLDDPLSRIAWSPDGKWLAVSGTTVLVLDVRSGKEVFRPPAGPDKEPFWSPDGRRLMTRGDVQHGHESREEIQVWDPATGSEVVTLRSRPLPGQFSPNGRWFASTPSRDGEVIVTELISGNTGHSLTPGSQRRR